VSPALAQVLVRRGLDAPAAARAFLEATDVHEPGELAGVEEACALVRRHVAEGGRITVHGDYDVDGVCSTAILVGALRGLGASVDWYLPSRAEDGYGLSVATVERLAARGTRLLVTVDCGVTAVDEVDAARAAGLDVLVTDHHSPRADGELPDAPLVHPALGAYPCPFLCAAGVAHKLATALLAASGRDDALADADLDLVALATVADCVPLVGENRRLVRAGLRALATTRRPGLRALMHVARVDPSRADARAVGFRLAPRLNAAGRLHRADAALELLLTDEPARPDAIAAALDAANAERRHVETRILFEAEAQVREAGERPAYVLAGEGWHRGVIGIVASRIAERHHRPCVLVALDGERGTGSGRSIPAFDLLAGLDAAASHLERHGGHRAAAGCEVRRDALDGFRAAFEAHAAAVLRPEDLVPVETVDAVVAGDELGTELAEELERLAPFGAGNRGVSLLVPAARLSDPRTIGDGKHLRFTVTAGGRRASAVAFGTTSIDADGPVDATFGLELHEWGGAVEPRLVLRHARRCAPGVIEVVGEDDFLAAVLAEVDAPVELPSGAGAGPFAPLPPGAPAGLRDRRCGGIAGTLGALVHSGEPVLAVVADARMRARQLGAVVGGFALCSHAALARAPGLAARFAHLVAVDPPVGGGEEARLLGQAEWRMVHLAWGQDELDFAVRIHEREHELRAPLAAVYRALRDLGAAEGEELEAALRGDPGTARTPTVAGRALRILAELGLVSLDRETRRVVVPAARRTSLEQSATYRHCQRRHQDGLRYLTGATARAA
jgi:single-stranded-DNA-specific exonuclease